MPCRTAGLALCAALAAIPALAGRPLSTEDASALADKACQVESWADRYRDATQGWLVPACNFGAGIEWQLGAARTCAEGRSAFSEAYFQAKTVLGSLEDSPWGYGLVAGVGRKPLAESHRGWSNPYLIVPVSVKAGAEALVHLNLGASHDREARRTVTLWGIAAEAPVHARIHFVAEAFGENAQKPFVRAGLRYSAIANHLDLDLTVVVKPGGTSEERYVSLGFTWVSPWTGDRHEEPRTPRCPHRRYRRHRSPGPTVSRLAKWTQIVKDANVKVE